MQKIKYIIIFTLLLALGLLYIQLCDYDKITNTLLNDNKLSYETEIILKNKISTLETDNLTLSDKINNLEEHIITLEENLSVLQLTIQNNIPQDINYTIEQNIDINQEIMLSNENSTEEEIEEQNENLNPIPNITPSITMDDENQITGFGIEYKEEF